MTIKYRYALNNTNDLVDIHKLERINRRAGAPYSCLGCGAELIPHLGQHRAKHFNHQQAQECSGETYLHRLAKQVFFDTYTNSLANGQPFTLEIRTPSTCGWYEAQLGFTCNRQNTEHIDLTRHFDRVDIEQTIASFRADILLSSSHRSEVILIEFVVTHACEVEKI